MAALPVSVKRYIVENLACFDTPSQVSKAVKEEFGLDVPRTHVQKYDPTKAAGKDLSAELRALFDSTRQKFRDNVESIPIANQTVRLHSLNRMHGIAIERNNLPLAAQFLEQAAKELGGAYTNARIIAGSKSAPLHIKHTHATASELTDEELAAIATGQEAADGGNEG